MPSLFSRSKTKGAASISHPNPFPYDQRSPAPAGVYIDAASDGVPVAGANPSASASFRHTILLTLHPQKLGPSQSQYSQQPLPQQISPQANYQPYAAESPRPAPQPPNNLPYSNLQRSDLPSDPAGGSPIAAHDSPNLDQRDSEPKRSIRERLGLTGGISRENLLDTSDEPSTTNRLRRKASSARRKEPYQTSPQSPPPSGSGRTTPQFGRRRPVEIPEAEEAPASETENLRDLAAFFRSTAPPSDPRRRPVSLVGDPSTAQAHWNKTNNQPQAQGDHPPQHSRPRSGSLGDSLERPPTSKLPLQTEASAPTPLQTSPGGPVHFSQAQYQAYHPVANPEARDHTALPPLQTQGPKAAPATGSLHLNTLSPLRQNPIEQAQLSQRQLATESPPHFEVQGPDQGRHPDSLEHGIATELTGHLVGQQGQQQIPSNPQSHIVSPTEKVSPPGMPTNSANLQLPPRRGSAQEGSEPPTPNTVNQSKMQQATNQGVQRAQTTADPSAGRNTPPPQFTAKDLSEEEINNLLRDYKELSAFTHLFTSKSLMNFHRGEI